MKQTIYTKEIKFRAWDKKEKEWINIDRIGFHSGCILYIDDKWGHRHIIENIIITQQYIPKNPRYSDYVYNFPIYNNDKKILFDIIKKRLLMKITKVLE